MKIYEFLAAKNFPSTYTGKVLLVSFLGVHLPMFGAVGYALLSDATPFMEQIDILIAMLIATLIGTIATMFVMVSLLAPITAATNAANEYLRERKLPRLPSRYTDGAGVLMSSVQECITRLDGSITSTELSRSQLEQDYTAKFKIIAGMRHDFRTPLTHILGFAEIMRAEAIGPIGTEAYKNYIAKIGASGADLLKTLNSVIDLSDLEVRRQMIADSGNFNLVEVAQDAIALEHLHAEKRDVIVRMEAPDRIVVHSVKDAVRDLLIALLQATIAASPAKTELALSISDDRSITLRSPSGRLSLEDVPPQLAQLVQGRLVSITGLDAEEAETSTPMTLRLSLVHSLATAIGGNLAMKQDDIKGYEIKVEMMSLVDEYAMAAE
jgi:signal transduction histidine kinase